MNQIFCLLYRRRLKKHESKIFHWKNIRILLSNGTHLEWWKLQRRVHIHIWFPRPEKHVRNVRLNNLWTDGQIIDGRDERTTGMNACFSVIPWIFGRCTDMYKYTLFCRQALTRRCQEATVRNFHDTASRIFGFVAKWKKGRPREWTKQVSA